MVNPVALSRTQLSFTSAVQPLICRDRGVQEVFTSSEKTSRLKENHRLHKVDHFFL